MKEDSYSSTAKIERLQVEKVDLEKAVKKLSKESQQREKCLKKTEAKVEAFEKRTTELVSDLDKKTIQV